MEESTLNGYLMLEGEIEIISPKYKMKTDGHFTAKANAQYVI